MWNQAVQAWMGGKEPAAPSAPPPGPTPMPAAPAEPATQAAKSIPDLFNAATNVNSVEEIMQIGNALLEKKNELLTMPGAANKLFDAIKTMRKRRQTIVTTPPSPTEHKMWTQLNNMVGEIHAQQG